MGWWSGSGDKYKQLSTLSRQQVPLQSQMIQSTQQPGAGGAFGDVADYYRDLMSDNSQDYQALQRPEMRKFNEQIVPGIGEEFAGMGSGALSSSGFRNQLLSAGTDLTERLGAIRNQLKAQGAQGLTQMGQNALQPTGENILEKGYEGAGGPILSTGGAILGAYFGGPGGAKAGYEGGNRASGGLKSQSATIYDQG